MAKQAVITTSEGVTILRDPHWDGVIDSGFFEPEAWRARGALAATPGGRGSAWFVQHEGRNLVLRHYRRGGWASLLGDRYLWTGLERTRSVREWHLHNELYERGLPVPRAVAARVQRFGLFYRADIVTERITNAVSLAQQLARAPLPPEQWREIGRCLRRFHAAAVWHPDMTAHNLLLSGRQVYLVDFDKSRFDGAPARLARNLARLRRSLIKLTVEQPGVAITPQDWSALLVGYSGASDPEPFVHHGTAAA